MARMGRGNWAQDKIIIASYAKSGGHVPIGRYVVDLTGLRDPGGAKKGTFPAIVTDGTDIEVGIWIAHDPRVRVVLDQFEALAHAHLAIGNEQYISLDVVDPQGIWIGPAVAELAATRLAKLGWSVATKHYALSGDAV